MQIFIDETGDPGFRIEDGSSRFFIVALVIFEDKSEADKARSALKNLKKEWKKKDSYEFKFTKLSHFRKSEFFLILCKEKLKLHILI